MRFMRVLRMKRLIATFFCAGCILPVLFTDNAFAESNCTGWAYYDADLESCVTCENHGFTITTTSLPTNTEFWFSMSPKGSFAVDWGGEIQNIDRDNTTAEVYTHPYTTGGVKNIKFCGKATEYNSSTGDNVVAAISFYNSADSQGSQIRIASVSGSLGDVFPTLGNGTSADQQPRFRSTFQGARNLTDIPATLFSGVSGSADGMFRSTFDKCSKLRAIPYGLFANATGGAQNMFRSTFYQCFAITSLPDDLFAGITAAANNEFMYTLYDTTGLTGKYIPASTFTGLINANPPSPTTPNMWTKTFDVATANAGLGLVKTCPVRTHDFITGYEGTTANSTWAGYVSCIPNNPCTGTEYWDSTNQVCAPCPTGYTYDTSDTKESINQCLIQCAAGTYLANTGDTTCTNAGVGYYAEGSVVAYGSTSSPTQCPDNMPTVNNAVNASSESQCVVYCRGANYRNSSTNACISCPAGYDADDSDGKTAATDCKIHCDGGTYLPTANAPSCDDVGDGFYAAATTVAYGSTSGREQCPNGEMTGTLNASSASQCIELCAGATYRDSSTGACVPCPIGYNAHTLSGKISINECQIQCAAGTYIARANDNVCSNVGDGYYAAASTINYGSVGSKSQCPNGQTTGTQTATSRLQCLTSCLGITYYDPDTDQCESCPTGYTDNTSNGKSDISQCQRHCNGGTTTETYTPILYLGSRNSKQFIDTGYVVTSDNVSVEAVVSSDRNVASNINYGNFFGNIYKNSTGEGFSGGYKNGVFGFWSDKAGKKAQITKSFELNKEYTFVGTMNTTRITVEVSDGNGTVSDSLNVSNTTNTQSNSLHLFSNGGTINNNGVIEPKGSGYGDQLFMGKIHSFKLYDGNVLVLDLIPVRRNSDNVLGMYNRVNGEFYANAGTDTFVAGADNGATFAACSPVGNGYYVAANDTNYGSTGTRNACPNNLSTVSNGVIINNATSIYQCDTLASCTGATYPNQSTGVCTSCPTGYDSNIADGKESIHDCQIHCSGGTYLANAQDTTCTNVGDGYYAAASDINYGDIGTRSRCPNDGVTNKENATDVSECQLVVECTGATYMNSGVCEPCPTGYVDNTANGKDDITDCQINCPVGAYIATATASTCTDAGVGYWAAGGMVNYGSTSTHTQCAAGLTTIGYGHGADELADCGRKLHIDNHVIYAKTTKPTTHTINIQPVGSDTVFYIGVSDSNQNLTPLHVTQGDTQYTAFDDSILYGERDFETGARIIQ